MTDTCLAAVITRFGEPTELREVPLPDVEPGGVLVRVDAATLCGTDVHLWSGNAWIGEETLPYIPGHETAGTVVSVGGDVTDIVNVSLQPGDRVIATYPYCGHCYFCTVANTRNLCVTGVRYGRERADRPPYLLGGTAEYHYFPPGSEIVRIPDEVTAPLAASAACAVRTVMFGFERLGTILSHETVVVQGAGPIGLYAAAAARAAGARKVYVIGAPAERLELARAFGVDDVLNLEEVTDAADRVAWVRDRTNGLGADVVVQGAGSLAIPEGLEMARRGGRYLSIGNTDGDLVVPARNLSVKQLTIIGVVMAEGRHFYQALQFLATQQDRFPFDRMITGVYDLAGTGAALQAMADLKEIKPVILPNAGR
jgi:L-iditol 2-dehydrogenase